MFDLNSFLEKANKAFPEWVDPEFLYKTNYGGGNSEDARMLFDLRFKLDRDMLLLLDRKIANKLLRALFEPYYRSLGNTRGPFWTDADEIEVDMPEEKILDNITSERPLDWAMGRTAPREASHPYSQAIVTLMHWMITRVWNPNKDYPSYLHDRVRPPIVAIAECVESLVKHLAESAHMLPSDGEQLFVLFKNPLDVLDRRLLRTLAINDTFNEIPNHVVLDWTDHNAVVHVEDDITSFLCDILFLGLPPWITKDSHLHTPYHWDKERGPDTQYRFRRFPGSDLMIRSRQPVTPKTVKTLYGSLAEMKASYINSGPYKLEFTDDPEKHLTLHSRSIMIYCAKPHENPFLAHKQHILGE